MSVIHAPREPTIDLRQASFLMVVGIAFSAFLVRLWYLQVVRSEQLTLKAQAHRTMRAIKHPPRGLIFDRKGRVIAGVEAEVIVTAQPGIVRAQPWVLEKLAGMLGVPEARLAKTVEDSAWRPFLPTPIHAGVPVEVAARIAEAGDALPGIGVEAQSMRTYSNTVRFAHVLGYVWTPNDRDVERLKAQGLQPGAFVGKDGLERQYEAALMGRPGLETIEVDTRRRPQRVVQRDAPTPGQRLVLTVDRDLQDLAMRLLEGRRGAAVAIEPSSGEILCMASSPSYDTNLFVGGIGKEEWQRLQDDPGHPLLNRAVASRYSPGSTFKLVTSLAAYRTGNFSPYATLYCPGYFQVGNKRVRCLGTHGAVRFETALARSCNAYFSQLGSRAGHAALVKAALDSGLGAKTGVDLPTESRGLIPTEEWLESLEPPKKWYPGDTVNMSLGQGETAATPLQMACLASLVANRGVSYVPHFLRSRAEPGGEAREFRTEKRILARVEASPEFWSALRGALVQVIEAGTGSGSAKLPGLVWAGKTGSAEHRRNERTHSWFIGYAPADDPKIAVAVLVEAAGHGSDVAAPIARGLVKSYLFGEGTDAAASRNREAASTASDASRPKPDVR